MSTNKSIILVISLALTLALVPLITYADTLLYGPAPTPIIYKTYTISMNLTDSRPTVQFLESIRSEYPLAYREDSLIVNATPVWLATAGREFTLYIANASVTTIRQGVLLRASAIANSTGGITWALKVPLYLTLPQQPVYANWYVVITESVGGSEYVVFVFETGNESLMQLLEGLSTVGGYLIALNGEPYYLWNYYYGYNPATQGVGEYYEVGLPGISVFTMWVGQGVNASSWPSQAFPEILKVLRFSFSEYANSTLVARQVLSPNTTIGELTNYGYAIYQRPRLIPFGPTIYLSPIPLLPNGTIVNPTCLPNTYYLLRVEYVALSGYAIPIYITRNYPTGLYLLNESLLFGGYLQAYDFYNRTVIPITPEQYLMPPYESQVSGVTWCTLQVFKVSTTAPGQSNITGNGQISSGKLGEVAASIDGISINKAPTNGDAPTPSHGLINHAILMHRLLRVLMELRLR